MDKSADIMEMEGGFKMQDGATDKRKSGHKELLALAGLLIFPFIFFMPVLAKNININIGDGIGYEINQLFFKDALSEGRLPLWNKYVALGTSFVGDIQNKVFYPFTWLCALFPEKLAFKFFYVIHIALAEVFMYFFCRQLKCSKSVSIFGSFAFSFSNLIIIRYEHINILCCLIWIPLIFAFLIRYFNTAKRYNLVIMAAAMSMQFMAGFPQTAFYSDLFVFSTLLFLNFKNRQKIKEIITQAAIIGAVYAGLCMVQILPLLEIMQFSGRDKISYEYFSDGAANIWQVFNLISPNATGDFAGLLPGTHEFPTDTYLGIIPLTLIVFAGRYMHKNKNVIYLFLYAAFALLFSCACSNVPILGKVIYMLPVFGSFRTTTRMLAFFVIPLLIISILALQYIWEENLWKKYLTSSSWMLLLMIIVYGCIQVLGRGSENAVLQYYVDNRVGGKSIVLLAVLCILVFVLCKTVLCNTVLPGRYTSLIVLAAAAFQIFDVYFFNIDASTGNWRLQNMARGRAYEEVFNSNVKDALMGENSDKRARYFVSFYTWQELAETSWSIRPNGNMLAGLPMIQSYITFNNPNLLELADTTYGMMMNADQLVIAENQSLIDLLNIGYVVTKKNQKPLRKYSYDGVIYEEYGGVQAGGDIEIPLGDIEGDSYIEISIDAEVNGDGAVISLYSGSRLLDEIGSFSRGVQFYGYHYAVDGSAADLKFVVGNGENVKINGIRFEKYTWKPPGEYSYDGIIYEEYSGRQLGGETEIPLGDIEGNSRIEISIDAEADRDGAVISLYSGSQLLEEVGSFSREIQFYGYHYAADAPAADLKFIVEGGEGIKLNGIRFEKYCWKDLPAALDIVYEDNDYTIYKNMENAGHLLVFENAEPVGDALEYVTDNKSSLQFTKDAYLDKADHDIKLTGCSGTVNTVQEEKNAVKAEVTITSEQAIVGFSESYYPGWHVYIDGQNAELLEIDGIIQGVAVPNGTHEVIFKYSPQSVKIGALITCISILAIAAYLAMHIKHRRNLKKNKVM